MAKGSVRAREDILGVLLAELLERRGLWSVPGSTRRRNCQVHARPRGTTLVDLDGARVVVEGSLLDGERDRQRLFDRARRHVEGGLGSLCLAVLYPPRLRDAKSASELRRALDEEIARGVLLVKGTPPEDLGFRDRITVEIAAPGGTVAVVLGMESASTVMLAVSVPVLPTTKANSEGVVPGLLLVELPLKSSLTTLAVTVPQ